LYFSGQTSIGGKQSRRFILEVATASPRNDFVDCHALWGRNDRPKSGLFQRPQKGKIDVEDFLEKVYKE